MALETKTPRKSPIYSLYFPLQDLGESVWRSFYPPEASHLSLERKEFHCLFKLPWPILLNYGFRWDIYYGTIKLHAFGENMNGGVMLDEENVPAFHMVPTIRAYEIHDIYNSPTSCRQC